MKTHHPFVRALLLSVLMGMLVASAALAKTGGLGFIRLSAGNETTTPCPSPSPSPAESPSPSPSPTESPSPSPLPSESPSPSPSPSESPSDVQEGSDEQESDDEGTSDEHESDDCQDSDKEPKPRLSPSADREKACMEAAGISDGSTGGGSETKTTGLDHAIEVVLANCIKNPQAPGLLNALRHMVANRDRHTAHDEEKAARKAAHDAEKAARQAAKASNGHGH